MEENEKAEIRADLLTNGYKHLPREEQLNMFGSALAMVLLELASETSADTSTFTLKSKKGELKVDFKVK